MYKIVKSLTKATPFAALAMVAAMHHPQLMQAQGSVPHYEVDKAWPAPLPDNWVLGPVGAVCVDAQDHVFLLNRQDELDVYNPSATPGQNAPPVIELDPAGRVVNSWKEEMFTPALIGSLHGCNVDPDNNVWIVATTSGAVQKFSHDGTKLLMQIGKTDVMDSSDGTRKGKALNSDAALFFSPASVEVERETGNIYVDDGDGGGNRRIAVMDSTGKFLRQFHPNIQRSVHCMSLSNDGLVYLCARTENQLQVYDRMGNFKKNIDVAWTPYHPITPAEEKRVLPGSAANMTLSRDKNQRFMFVINQNNSKIDVLDRLSGKLLTSFGRAGHFAGDFDQPLSIAADSKGYVYVTEHRGKRVQRFKPVG